MLDTTPSEQTKNTTTSEQSVRYWVQTKVQNCKKPAKTQKTFLNETFFGSDGLSYPQLSLIISDTDFTAFEKFDKAGVISNPNRRTWYHHLFGTRTIELAIT